MTIFAFLVETGGRGLLCLANGAADPLSFSDDVFRAQSRKIRDDL